jgi:hypothetical protein
VLVSLHFYDATGCSPLVYFRVKKCRKYNPDKYPMVILHKIPCDVDSGDIFRDVESDISSDGCCQRAGTVLVLDASGLQISYSVSSREYVSFLQKISWCYLSCIVRSRLLLYLVAAGLDILVLSKKDICVGKNCGHVSLSYGHLSNWSWFGVNYFRHLVSLWLRR